MQTHYKEASLLSAFVEMHGHIKTQTKNIDALSVLAKQWRPVRLGSTAEAVEFLHDLLNNLGDDLLELGLLSLEARKLSNSVLDVRDGGELEAGRASSLGIVATLVDDIAVVGSTTTVPGEDLFEC